MLAQKIRENIYWVGAIDWSLRNFHGYQTTRGSSYNAYLIIDEKITLIDNVKKKFTNEMLSRISSVINPKKIDIIISNHGEPDHSGSLLKMIELAPQAKIYSSSPNGVKILNLLYGDLPIIPVKNNETLSIGKRTLRFIHSPMVHWPDNMVTYLENEKILFSNDIFGQHLATSNRFDYEFDLSIALYEAKKYYANIVWPYSSQAFKIADKLKELKIEMIATSHGLIWEKHISDILNLYKSMISYEKKDKAVIVYDTMWGSTEVIAKTIAETFQNSNIMVTLYNVNDTHDSDIVSDIFDSKFLAVGSSTLNNNMLPTIASLLCYLKGLGPKDMKFISFGSYGWGGQSVELIDKELEEMHLERLISPIKIQYAPKEEQIKLIANDIYNAINK